MTSGTKTIDNRYSQVFFANSCYTSGIPVNVTSLGYISQKSWVGADSPRTPKEPFRYIWYNYPVYRGWQIVGHRRARMREYQFKHARPKMGENPYHMTLVRKNTIPISLVGSCGSGTPIGTYSDFYNSGQFFSITDSFNGIWSDNDTLRAINKLADRISGEQFNMLVFLGEGREALETIANSAARIYRASKALRRGNVSKAWRYLASGQPPGKLPKNISHKEVSREWFASNWLQMQYGWMPLVKDIDAAANHFAHQQNRPQTLTYRSRATVTKKLEPNSPGVVVIAGSATASMSIKAIVSKIDEYALLGLTDPASLVWEKLPYSFVADWILPVGNYLSAVNLKRALSAQYVISRKFVMSQNGYSYIAGDRVMYPAFADSLYQKVTLDRDVYSTLDVPLPKVKGFDKIASWQHAANSVALLVNKFPFRD